MRTFRFGLLRIASETETRFRFRATQTTWSGGAGAASPSFRISYFLKPMESTEQQAAGEIEKIYNEAIAKLRDLGQERRHIVDGYIKELEEQKIRAIRSSLGLG